MKKIFTKQWFKAAGIRSLKTVCQTAVATIGTSAVLSSVDWRVVLSASLLAGGCLSLTALPACRRLRRSKNQNRPCRFLPAGARLHIEA